MAASSGKSNVPTPGPDHSSKDESRAVSSSELGPSSDGKNMADPTTKSGHDGTAKNKPGSEGSFFDGEHSKGDALASINAVVMPGRVVSFSAELHNLAREASLLSMDDKNAVPIERVDRFADAEATSSDNSASLSSPRTTPSAERSCKSGKQDAVAHCQSDGNSEYHSAPTTFLTEACYCCKRRNNADPCLNLCDLHTLPTKKDTFFIPIKNSTSEDLSCYFVFNGPRPYEQKGVNFFKQNKGIFLIIQEDCMVEVSEFEGCVDVVMTDTKKLVKPDLHSIWIHGSHQMIAKLAAKFQRRHQRLYIRSTCHDSKPVSTNLVDDLLKSSTLEFHNYELCKEFFACLNVMGVRYFCKPHYWTVEFQGRVIDVMATATTRVKGVQVEKWEEILKLPCNISKVDELKQKIGAKKMITAFLDGRIDLVFEAFLHLMDSHPEWKEQARLGFIGDARQFDTKVMDRMLDINKRFGTTVVDVQPLPFTDRWPVFCVTDCLVYTPICDGNDSFPEEYTVSREKAGKSCLLLSYFVNSALANSALCTNPWDVEMTGDALHKLLSLPEEKMRKIHQKRYKQVKSLKD